LQQKLTEWDGLKDDQTKVEGIKEKMKDILKRVGWEPLKIIADIICVKEFGGNFFFFFFPIEKAKLKKKELIFFFFFQEI